MYLHLPELTSLLPQVEEDQFLNYVGITDLDFSRLNFPYKP
jgi:hypothetical protein